jgi:hypothetical protein
LAAVLSVCVAVIREAIMEELGCDPEGKCMKCFTVPPDIQVNDT